MAHWRTPTPRVLRSSQTRKHASARSDSTPQVVKIAKGENAPRVSEHVSSCLVRWH